MEANGKYADATFESGLSLDFIRAVAQLLETDPDDIVTELGNRVVEKKTSINAVRTHAQCEGPMLQIGGYYLG